MSLLLRRYQSLLSLCKFSAINSVWYLLLLSLLEIGICTCRIAYWWIGNNRFLPTESTHDTFPMSIQTLTLPLSCSHEKYHLGDICSIRVTIHFCTPYFHVWDEKIAQNLPCSAFTTFPHATHVPLHFLNPLSSYPFTRPLNRKIKNYTKD